MRPTVNGALPVLARLVRPGGALSDVADSAIVGGAVRSALLGLEVREIDLAVSGDAARFAAEAASALGSHVVEFGREHGGVRRIPLLGGDIDVVPMQGRLAQDLAGRDFTVNALALPLRAPSASHLTPSIRPDVVDPHGGIADLDARRLRLVGPNALRSDPVRALRGVRLACDLGFDFDDATWELLAAHAALVTGVAAERVGAELMRIFGGPAPGRGARLLDESRLLGACFPALEAGREVEQRPFHRYRVLEHQLVAVEWMQTLLSDTPPSAGAQGAIWDGLWGAPWPETRWGALRPHLVRQRVALHLAALLHDVGKPATLTVDDEGRTRFFGHSELGAQIARGELLRWRMPHALVERVALLVEQHLRPGQAASPGEEPTGRALHRFQRALGDATPDVCLLFLADSLATAGADALLPRWHAYVAHVRRIITWRPPAAPGRDRLIDGRELMAATGLDPGPAVGRLLEVVDEAAADGRIATREEALELARALAGGER